MNVDVLSSLSSAFSGPIVKQLSGYLGEPEAGTRSALGSIGPALLGILMQKSTSSSGAGEVFRTVTGSSIDSGIVGKLSSLLGNRSNLEPLISGGDEMVGSLLGNRAGGVTHAVSQVSGISPSSATALFSIAAPVLLGFLKKTVGQGNLDAGGLSRLLLGQRNSLERAGLDSRVTSALGFGSLTNWLGSVPGPTPTTAEPTEPRATATPVGTTPTYTPPPPTMHPRARRGWVPWAVMGALAIVAGLLWSNRNAQRTNVTSIPTASERAVDPSADVTQVAALPAKVYFESGEVLIDEPDRQTIAQLAQALQGIDGQVAVTGYADRTGSPEQNLELAKDRATAVREVLVAEGVDEDQIVMSPPTFVTGSGEDAEARRVEITLAQK